MNPITCASPNSGKIRRLRFHSVFASLLLMTFSPVLSQAETFLFDFGADATQTLGGGESKPVFWNDVTAATGANNSGLLPDLLTTAGDITPIAFEMIARFNGANESGTPSSPLYPATATRDSLFGNTEAFGNLENLNPSFKLTGIPSGTTCTLTFFASRLGATDNREARYTVIGASEKSVDLDASNNVTNTVKVTSMAADADGVITINITAGPNNNNANHFTYLGVLQMDLSTGARLLIDFGAAGSSTGTFQLPPGVAWNNITTTIGNTSNGELPSLVTTNGTATTSSLKMISRFNGANSSGTTASTVLPVTATQDSLFGNTEVFSGLSNIVPSFKLTGLKSGFSYAFTFFASRTGATDIREARYNVKGLNSGQADLNASNNTNNTVTVSGIVPDSAGEIIITLTPGPNNNNANHFAYLGAMRVDSTPVRPPTLLVDFGANGTPTTFGTTDPDNHWNNVNVTIGATSDGSLTNLVRTDGTTTPIGFSMISRFNGANENGTTAPSTTGFVTSATRDSLFGNTEPFNSLENITPAFKLTGLTPAIAYDFGFFASRMGVGDTRETLYTVKGATESSVTLNASNNESEIARVTGVKPDAAGEISIALAPSENNNNANHFIYLGVLEVTWQAQSLSTPPTLSNPAHSNGTFSFTLTGSSGKTYKIQRTRAFTSWSDVQSITLTSTSQSVQVPQAESEFFYRAVEQ